MVPGSAAHAFRAFAHPQPPADRIAECLGEGSGVERTEKHLFLWTYNSYNSG